MEHQHCVKQKFGPEICKKLLFFHAKLGYDTTSQLYGIRKGVSLKKFRLSKHFRELAEVFYASSATPKDIIAAGEQALVKLYNGKPGEALDCLHYKCFCEKVATNTTFPHPQTLPPIVLWQLPNTTASVYTYKCRGGKTTAMNFIHFNGGGKNVTGL